MKTSLTFRKRLRATALGLALIATSAACTTNDTAATDAGAISAEVQVDGEAVEVAAVDIAAGEVWLFDSSVVHDIEIEFDQDEYDEAIATYETTGDKDWIEATITVDGTTLDNVGLRLKGNSSLFGLTTETSGNPEDLPWLIRFDKYVDGQTYQGYGDLVIRSNSTETAMNEAVAVELLGEAGLATEQAMATAFTVNGGETELRLAMEHPDEVWVEANFDAEESALYKADSEGDYSYRGDDPDSYDDVFNQKAGEDDLTPIIEFLDFINNSDDATFAAELGDHLDTEAFATYLAFQDLIGNADDIDGRGNNSYLFYDGDTDQMTVVNWDLNLAFNTANVGQGGGPGAAGGEAPGGGGRGARPEPPAGGPEAGRPVGGGQVEGGQLDDGQAPGGQGAVGPGAGGSNVLAERFRADETFAQMYADATAELAESLYANGTANTIVDSWVTTLTEQASNLVDAATIEAEADALRSWIQGV